MFLEANFIHKMASSHPTSLLMTAVVLLLAEHKW